MIYFEFYRQDEPNGEIYECAPRAWSVDKVKKEYKRLTDAGGIIKVIKCEDVTGAFR